MKNAKRKSPISLVQHAEHPNVEKHDWRLHAATSTTRDSVINGNVLPAGSVVTVASPLRISKKGDVLNLGAPNVTAMFIDLADQMDRKSSKLHQEVIDLAKSGKYDVSDDTRLFDALENRMGSALFAFTALESFANEHIEIAYAQGYRYEQKLRSGLFASHDIESVERKVALEEKIATVLPAALDITSPKGRTTYNQFNRLKGIRDRIVHLKGKDRGPSQDKTLWRELMSSKSADFALQAYGLIAHFYNQKPSIAPRWFAKFGAAKGLQ